jgi:hypothetical protein
MGLLMVSPLAANAATNRLSGTAFYDATQCPGPPAGYEDFTSYPGLVMTGSLQGCLYTKVETTKDTPGGVYLESGEEVFVGSLDGGPLGSFATTYRLESKWDPDVSTEVEVRGRCQHPIVEGRGTGGLEGARGRVDFKDIIGDPVTLSAEVTSASANTVAKCRCSCCWPPGHYLAADSGLDEASAGCHWWGAMSRCVIGRGSSSLRSTRS